MTPVERRQLKHQIVEVLVDSNYFTDFDTPDVDAQAEAILDLIDKH